MNKLQLLEAIESVRQEIDLINERLSLPGNSMEQCKLEIQKRNLQHYNLLLHVKLHMAERQEIIDGIIRTTNEINQVKKLIGEASGNNGQLYKKLRELQVHQLWLLGQVEWDSDDIQ